MNPPPAGWRLVAFSSRPVARTGSADARTGQDRESRKRVIAAR
ncbi:hypothetical protein [Sphingobium sp. CR28]